MELKDYCNNLATELTGWKAKMYDVARKMDKLSTGEKTKIVNEVNEIHMIIEELTDRVERLKKECPTQWGPDEMEMNEKSTTLRLKLEEVSKTVSPSDIGG
ncbi:MAG: hypothetical protein H6R43_668 [Nitrospirae bacterium]|jgi:predicted nuclease with TOPRIM domain|nr:hypothetical protein [Nitrospirota bacterium]